ncbi:MAG: hypothetical protein ABIB93_03840 [Chloroflexota bacterium]
MTETPTLLKVLKYLRDCGKSATADDVITAIGESQTRVTLAIAKLVSVGVIKNAAGSLRYSHTARAEEFSQKFFELYEKVIRQPEMEILVRGLLCHIGNPRAYLRTERLLEALEKEGFSRDTVTEFLDREERRRCIERLKVIFTNRGPGSAAAVAYQYRGGSKWLRVIPIPRVPYPSPLAISTYYMSSSRDVSTQAVTRLREEFLGSDPSANEEDYIIGLYPSKVSGQALKYLLNEKPEMARALKEEAFQQWYGLRYSW